MQHLRNSQRGSALIQVLIASALVSITALLTASIATNMSDATARANFDSEVLNEVQLVRAMLADADVCTANMRGATGAVPREESATSFRVNLLEANRNGGAVTLSGREMVKSRHYRGATAYRRTDNVAVLRLQFTPTNRNLQARRREVILTTTFGADGRVITCNSQGVGGESTGGGDVVPGNIPNISGGCGVPPSGSGGGISSSGGNPSPSSVREMVGPDGKNAADKWKDYCRQQTFPLGKSSYQIYRDDESNHQVRKLGDGQSSVSGAQIQMLGPYANLFQCENDGLNPSGSIHQWRTGGGSGQDGSGSGGDNYTAVCINGTWARASGAWGSDGKNY